MTITMQELTPQGAHGYLRASSAWEIERENPVRTIWRHKNGAKILIPVAPSSDAPQLLRLAANEIARAEGRTEDEVRLDLHWSAFDKLHLRRDAPTAAIGFEAGLDVHSALQDLIVAAARTATDPRRAYRGGRRPESVTDYLDQVRLVPAAAGSFVVRALLPLSAGPIQESLPMPGPAAPAVRAISAGILRSSRIAVETARQVFDGAPPRIWDDVVKDGVSANLCDALARLPGSGEEASAAQIQIDWTWSAPADSVEPITITPGQAPVLAAAADYLRDEPEEHTITLTGLVTRLHRDTALGPGQATVRGHVEHWDSGSRSVQLQLDEDTYRLAIAAHDQGSTVRTTALVRRAPRGLEVVRVEDLRLI